MNKAFKPLFEPKRFKVFYGGRGAGKSWTIANALLIKGGQSQMRILCTREFQSSIRDSVHKLLSDRITKNGLDHFYHVTQNAIYGQNGTEFLFHGLKYSSQTIKSLEGVDVCWTEEAQTISNESWETLIPTIRKDNSEIWLSMNPQLETDPTYQRFIKNQRPNQTTVKVNYPDNPFFSDALRSEMEYQKELDYNDYLHIWEGECKTATDAQIFKGKSVVHDFDSDALNQSGVFYFGLDWGFSQDPLAIIRCFIKDDDLYVDYEAGGLGVELDDTRKLIDTVPMAKDNTIRADNARPESISFVKRQGYNIIPVYKWAGSVQDGIEFIRKFKVIHIHTRCMQTASEFIKYSYKEDRFTGNILTDIVDKYNHYIDAIRYALQPRIKQRPGVGTMDLVGF